MPVAAIMTGYGIQLHPYTRAWIAAMTIKPTSAAAKAYDVFIRKIAIPGIWDTLDVLAGMPTHDEQSSLLNVVNPGTFNFNKVVTSGTGPVFIPYDGWECASGNGQVVTSENMSVMPKYSANANQSHYGNFVKSEATSTVFNDVGTITNISQTVMNSRYSATQGALRHNYTGTSWFVTTIASSIGHQISSLHAANDWRYIKDGAVLSVNNSNLARTVPASPFGMLGNASAQSRRRMTAGHCGSAISNDNALILYQALNQLISDVAAL